MIYDFWLGLACSALAVLSLSSLTISLTILSDIQLNHTPGSESAGLFGDCVVTIHSQRSTVQDVLLPEHRRHLSATFCNVGEATKGQDIFLNHLQQQTKTE